MARYSVSNFSHDNAHRKCYLVVSLLFILEARFGTARPTSANEIENDPTERELISQVIGTTWPGAVFSLGILLIMTSLLVLCGAGGCCGKIHWFGRRRDDAPLSFANPMTEPVGSTMMVPISQLDVRTLEFDPIVFEPLPTVHDLTPLSSKTQNDRGILNHRNSAPIVPFSNDDPTLYANDWFEEPLNNFPRSNIEYVKPLGKGWFGQVIEAEARDIVPFVRKMRVIVKLLREDATHQEQMRFLDESRMYRDASHGNILQLLGHSIEKVPFLLIMEHCPEGDLKSFLIANISRAELLNSQGTIIRMALDVAKGLEWLHNAGFVHPDLACRNCQVGSENRVVIGDYGLGTQNYKDDYHWISRPGSPIAIPLRWTAPETLHCTDSVIQILKVTESSNIWTLGVVIWELCEFGKLPYFELSDDEVISRVISDKNYFLGRPTIQCLSAQQELYAIMSSCWTPEIENRPRLYTVVRELEEVCNAFNSSTRSTKEVDFESKWEQLGSRLGSEEDKRRKKNVSFLDLENRIKQGHTYESPESETVRNLNMSTEASHVSDPGQFSFVTDQQLEPDLDDEHWTKKIERGDITQKVLEKSQSVQDLMVLTHFEQGDMGELDSLLYIGKPSQQSSPPEGSNGSSNSSTLRKTCSETAIDAISLANTSSHTLTPSVCDGSSQGSTIVPHSPCPSLFTTSVISPGVPEVGINVIPATPNPPVEINVIQATPNNLESTPEKADSTGTNGNSGDNKSSNPVINRKLHFKFDSPVTTNGKRRTSTPLRSSSTPSPRIPDCVEKDEEYPVFDTSENFMENTFGMSPISQHYISGSFNTTVNDQSVPNDVCVLFGASDDHELGTYQGVKSQLLETRASEDDSDSELKSLHVLTNTAQGQINFKNLPQPLTNGEKQIAVHEDDLKLSFEYPSSSSTEANGVQGDPSKESEIAENDDFWEQQLKSIQMATVNTRELISLSGLNDPDDCLDGKAGEDKRFVEDIEAEVEELGSLVLHDLEEPDAAQTVIKETREGFKSDDGVSAKLAFQASSASAKDDRPGLSESFAVSETGSNDSNLCWDLNNSIEIRKGKSNTRDANESATDVAVDFESDMDENEKPPLSEPFVPSKWNHSLVPSRSAIKSPEQQPKSGMKKSVSFERKKPQLVYEYPPPPMASDSEDEEKHSRAVVPPSSIPFSSSLDWELTQEELELENAEWNHEDSDEEVIPKPADTNDPMDLYRISGMNEDNFQVRGSSEPFVFSPSTLGELRHTRDRLRLDLSKGEANFLDDDPNKSSNPAKLDSGVGSSTNVSPFNNCDILTKRSKPSD